ncbi:MAG: hypothetical protein V2J51_09040 [Erythrobacter sp.]|jgi:hypothetical protein|nr:hypothetical protein [Erythrobacter sp.]
MLEDALKAVLALNDKAKNKEKLESSFSAARTRIQLFGTVDEVREFERLVKLVEGCAGGPLQGENLNAFPDPLVKNFCEEVGLSVRLNHSVLQD